MSCQVWVSQKKKNICLVQPYQTVLSPNLPYISEIDMNRNTTFRYHLKVSVYAIFIPFKFVLVCLFSASWSLDLIAQESVSASVRLSMKPAAA